MTDFDRDGNEVAGAEKFGESGGCRDGDPSAEVEEEGDQEEEEEVEKEEKT